MTSPEIISLREESALSRINNAIAAINEARGAEIIPIAADSNEPEEVKAIRLEQIADRLEQLAEADGADLVGYQRWEYEALRTEAFKRKLDMKSIRSTEDAVAALRADDEARAEEDTQRARLWNMPVDALREEYTGMGFSPAGLSTQDLIERIMNPPVIPVSEPEPEPQVKTSAKAKKKLTRAEYDALRAERDRQLAEHNANAAKLAASEPVPEPVKPEA